VAWREAKERGCADALYRELAARERLREVASSRDYRAFFEEVCRRAEANMLRTHKLEGMHWAAMQEVKRECDAAMGEQS